MSYYQSPMGDYKTYGYAGDPGFLSGLWRGIKTVGKIMLGIPPSIPMPRPVPQLPAPAPQRFPKVTSFPGGTMTQYGPPVRATPGRYPGRPLALPTPAQMGAPGEACPTGYHLAKDGSGRWVRNRRMNIANPRALRRAMRRVQGFEKLAKRTIQFTRRVKMKTRKS